MCYELARLGPSSYVRVQTASVPILKNVLIFQFMELSSHVYMTLSLVEASRLDAFSGRVVLLVM